MLTLIVAGFITLATISLLWARGVHNMQKNHPDYKGEDFLNWDSTIHTAGRDGWDDNKIHTENEI